MPWSFSLVFNARREAEQLKARENAREQRFLAGIQQAWLHLALDLAPFLFFFSSFSHK